MTLSIYGRVERLVRIPLCDGNVYHYFIQIIVTGSIMLDVNHHFWTIALIVLTKRSGCRV